MYICVHYHVLFDLTCALVRITVSFCFRLHRVLYLHDHVVLSRFTLVELAVLFRLGSRHVLLCTISWCFVWAHIMCSLFSLADNGSGRLSE